MPCTQQGMLSDTCPQWRMWEERAILAMYAVGDPQLHMFLVGDGGEKEDLCHVLSGGCSVTHLLSGDGEEDKYIWQYPVEGTLSDTCPHAVGEGEGEKDLSHVHSGGCSVTHLPSGGWGKRGGSQPCIQWRDAQ